MGTSIVSQGYLHRLPIRPRRGVRAARAGAGSVVRLQAVVAVLALLAVSSLGAVALERLGASLHGDVPPGWPASGCLSSSVAPLGGQVVAGQGRLCVGDIGMHGTLDVAHLEPHARYAEWIAYFESPTLCSFGALTYQVPNFSQPCTLADLAGPAPRGIALSVTASVADAQGALHLDGPVRALHMPSHAQAWLLVSRPAWSPAAYGADPLAGTDARELVARAVFDLP